ncbi:MAG TPA: hypothetical protein VMZ53_12460 [Kofleriaceae bacterium]|nr:hypothetical protein [Kofleriaceae bacterium]
MPVTIDRVNAHAMKFPDVSVGTKWGNRTWMINNKGFVWQRPLRASDLKRLGDEVPPSDPIIAIRTENLEAKDGLLAMDLPGFFTIQHFNGYPAVLVELKKARAADVRMAIELAYRAVATRRPRRRSR